MYIYRIVLDAYNSRRTENASARVVTYSRGFDRGDALRRIGPIMIAPDGTVSDGLTQWPGTNNMPAGTVTPRVLPEYYVVAIRSVKSAGTARILAEYM